MGRKDGLVFSRNTVLQISETIGHEVPLKISNSRFEADVFDFTIMGCDLKGALSTGLNFVDFAIEASPPMSLWIASEMFWLHVLFVESLAKQFQSRSSTL